MSANGELIVKVNTLECIVKAQQQQLEAFRSGERYMKLQKDFRRVIAGYERTIKNWEKPTQKRSTYAISGLNNAIRTGRHTSKKCHECSHR